MIIVKAIAGVTIGLALLFIWSACVVSSRCSREEESQEIQNQINTHE